MLVIADTGALISLGHIGKLHLIGDLFGDFLIPEAVWEELLSYNNPSFPASNFTLLEEKRQKINSPNYLKNIIDFGESEAIILYKELHADYLLIDDKKARSIAESLDVNCIGSAGILIKAKDKGLIEAIKPFFEKWIALERYFSIDFLNQLLVQQNEEKIV